MTLRSKLGVIYRRTLPKDIQNRFDCIRARRSWENTGVIFIHVPKCAGVSVSKALYGKTLGHIQASTIKSFDDVFFSSLPKIAVLRDPVDRYLSAYSYVAQNYERLKGSPGLPSLNLIKKGPEAVLNEWLLHKRSEETNYVFKAQDIFVIDHDGCIIVDKLIDFSSINSDMPSALKDFNISVDLHRLNSSSSLKKVPSAELMESISEKYHSDVKLYRSLQDTSKFSKSS